ncbi:hypothetical protein [Sorangium sp. So ce887]|uniref:hypothetical protein n=1 Tax=Sorangium sp. So ce887 TaxID=3133324 RepID=UPI003F617187
MNGSSRLGRGGILVLALAAARDAAATTDPDVMLCHFPPGNPENAQLMTIGAPAALEHVTRHGDAVCEAGDSDCCIGTGGAVCTNLQDDPDNCGACGNVCQEGQACTSGECTGCPTYEGTGCYWMDCFSFGADCCWVPSPFDFPSDVPMCQALDSCSPGGGELSGGGCYMWAECSMCTPAYPPWP